MSRTRDTVTRLRELDGVVSRLGQIAALLEWDQETNLPEWGVEDRASQIALVMGMHHEKIVDQEWGELFGRLDCDAEGNAGNVDDADRAFIRETYKRWSKKNKVAKKLVEEMARATSVSQAAWAAARKNNDFSAFRPHLERVLALKKEYARAVSVDKNEYDALLDEYEPGARGHQIAAVFDGLVDGLSELLDKIRGGKTPEASFLNRVYPKAVQDEFGRRIQRYMGYDFRRGRLDLSAHPFTTTLGPHDVRVTTRYNENQVLSGLFGNIHEAGHGLYEQGMGESLRNSILADGAGLGIHESQSRFWENTVGRSRAFWNRWFGEFRRLFPENLTGVGVEDFYRAVNIVAPSLIRVEADEVTYSFHVVIRFRLERALLRDDLAVVDLPEAWRTAYRELLGITPPNDADGCMQDVHWSVGLFGYFPTYALGNLYAAQFTDAMVRNLGPLDRLIENDEVGRILDWLRRNIHVHGRSCSPEEICRRVSGKVLDPGFFLDYLREKYSAIYGF